jgi:hypothetical protein
MFSGGASAPHVNSTPGYATTAFGMHSGGDVGFDASFRRDVPLSVFDGAPRFHSGGDILKPGEVPIIGLSGERMLNRDEARGYRAGLYMRGGNSGGVTVNVYNNSGSVQARTQQRPNMNGGFDIDVIIEEIDRHMADGITNGTSRTSGAIESAYGQTRAGGVY